MIAAVTQAAASDPRRERFSEAARALAALVERDPVFQGRPERLSWANDRWLYGISHLSRKTTGNRKTVYWLRAPTVFGSLLVPILATGAANSTEQPFWRWATVAVSLAVALCTALDQVVRPAARWRLVRETRSGLEAEGWAFLGRAGKYAEVDDDTRFRTFFEAVETLWANYEGIYLSQVAHSQELPNSVQDERREQDSAGT